MTASQASCGFPDDGLSGSDAGQAGSLPSWLCAEQSQAVLRARRFGRDLQVTRAAKQAVAALRADVPDPGSRLGLILATDRGDQHVLARRLGEVAERMGQAERAPAELFRAISYFPTGRVLKSVAEALGARGPVAVMPASLEQAHALAGVWLAAGRADLVAVVAADAADDGSRAQASAGLWRGGGQRVTSSALNVTGYAERGYDRAGATCAAMAQEVIEAVAPVADSRTALIVGSMLADAGEAMFAALSPRDPGPRLGASIQSLADRLGLGEVFVLVGSPGATMTGLGLAQDLVALGRADRVVVCGVDLVHGALARALGLLQCDDLPHMQGGAVAVMLEPRPGGCPAVTECRLLSPEVPARPGDEMDLRGIPRLPWDGTVPEQVVLSGLTSLELSCARQLAGYLWPGAPVGSPRNVRSVAADVLRLTGTARKQDLPMGIAAVHSLGGTGCCLLT